MHIMGLGFGVCIVRFWWSFLWQILGDLEEKRKCWENVFCCKKTHSPNTKLRGKHFLCGFAFFGSLLVFQSESRIIRQVETAMSSPSLQQRRAKAQQVSWKLAVRCWNEKPYSLFHCVGSGLAKGKDHIGDHLGCTTFCWVLVGHKGLLLFFL